MRLRRAVRTPHRTGEGKVIREDYCSDPARDAEDDMRASARALLWTLAVSAPTILALLYGAPWLVGVVQRWMLP